MSLNGLDEAKVAEAHQAALAEAGGWSVVLDSALMGQRTDADSETGFSSSTPREIPSSCSLEAREG